MSFNKGYELKKFEAHWEKLRIEYAAAGMTKEAIQKMYDYDRQQFNSERTFIERTQEFTAPAYESSEEEASPLMLRYQDAITVTDNVAHIDYDKCTNCGQCKENCPRNCIL